MEIVLLLLCLAVWVQICIASGPVPTASPTSPAPTISSNPTLSPSVRPTRLPSYAPSAKPSISQRPSTIAPTSPTVRPTQAPSGPTQAPTTATPTYFFPTPIPTSVKVVKLTEDPVALHQLIVTPPGGNKVIELKFYDPKTTLVSHLDHYASSIFI